MLGSGRGERIRTSDPLAPSQVRCQTAPRPDRARIGASIRALEEGVTRVDSDRRLAGHPLANGRRDLRGVPAHLLGVALVGIEDE
jgi:hypothetical protein